MVIEVKTTMKIEEAFNELFARIEKDEEIRKLNKRIGSHSQRVNILQHRKYERMIEISKELSQELRGDKR